MNVETLRAELPGQLANIFLSLSGDVVCVPPSLQSDARCQLVTDYYLQSGLGVSVSLLHSSPHFLTNNKYY